MDIGDAQSERDLEDNEGEEQTKDAKTVTGQDTGNKEHNNNNSMSKPKVSGLTLESIRQTISVLAPPSNQANIHRVPTAFPRTSNSLEHPAKSKFIFDALMDLGVELHEGSLVGGSFPTLGKLKNYFTDLKTRHRSSGNRPDSSPIPPVDSDPEVAKLRHQALLDQRMTQRKKI